MQTTVQALQSLQTVDRKIFRVERELERIPKEVERRKGDLARIEQTLAGQREASRKLRVQVKEVEDITTGQRQRLRKLEAESNKAGVDAAMLAHFEHEIRGIRHTISQAEDDGLKMVEQCEKLDEAAAQLEQQLAEEQRVFDEFSANAEGEMAEARARLEDLQARRAQTASQDIPPQTLDIYTRLLKIREGEALAQVVDQICQGCYVGIPKNLNVKLLRDELTQCPSCDRILFM